MRVAVLGPGGVGGFLAGTLDRAGASVIVVARRETAVQIERDGLDIESVTHGFFKAHPRVAETLEEPVDALIVATKAVTLNAALERIHAAPDIVVPLLNGLDHLALLRARFGERVVPAAIRIEATRTAPGRIEHTSPFLRVDLARPADPVVRAVAGELASTLERADVPTRMLDSEADVMWQKLARLSALALTTSAYAEPLGAIRDNPEHAAALEAAAREAVSVAVAEGAHVDVDEVLAEIADIHPSLRSSMSRDLEAGREPELDAIGGAVLRAGARHGIETPTVERLAACVARRAGIAPP